MGTPRDDDFVTNSDESKVVPDENPEPLEGTKTDEPDTSTTAPESETNDNSGTK
ncbi:hypothetical protein [Pontibacter qinzhouensis]|uniref:hypothetical protein n=1 Tax=Pontibacter qinzhouensis TaxID=2603253 RepID=UPI001650714D|nr:hypothetical protein [Pontibacter qinzhouensis]